MENSVMLLTKQILTSTVVILFVGMIFGKLSRLIKLPDVVLFLLAGIIIGPAVLNLISIDEASIANQLILVYGSAFILYEGGREIKLQVLNQVKVSVGLLSTLGVVVSSAVVGYAASYIFNIELIYGLLIGAIVASTDPASLIPVFQQVKIVDKIKQTVISESAFNDAMGTIAVFSVLTVIRLGKFNFSQNIKELIIMIFGGILVGAIVGLLISLSISNKKFGIFYEYAPIMSMIVVAISYVSAELIGGSGYMASFVAGLVCGNKSTFGLRIPDTAYYVQVHFRETLATIFRMSIFILLGTHVNFESLSKYWGYSVLIVLILMFVARPLSVWISTIFDKKSEWTFKEKLFIMWVRETGVIPAAMSGIVVSLKLPGYQIVSSVVFMAIIITLAFQATTTKWVAQKLGVLQESNNSSNRSA
ncbi:putative Na(+)/H(+) antiporter [Gottschalkia purinilytica]|uniref:Putative Na(+)/H(+) antiporter n=1 Tax=Gottschalkia purinilytica TaxID=1503 RepID=A0A0L0WAW8_GOTPU|nr:cation:proton antiporter [Gottschalkia purinilytica]KNF08674.1 putative Na(+)/H(+) antiporter [Gottschalkia purinilytica]